MLFSVCKRREVRTKGGGLKFSRDFFALMLLLSFFFCAISPHFVFADTKIARPSELTNTQTDLGELFGQSNSQPDPIEKGKGIVDREFRFDLAPEGSAGSLVAAGLETAGIAMQSAVLDYFEQGFSTRMGMLLYILSVMAAIGLVATGAHYKFGIWLLVGPFLFYWMLAPRVGAKAVSWKLGERAFDQLRVESITENVTEARTTLDENGNPIGGNRVGDVSWFFAYWDHFSSSLVTAVVSALRLDITEADLTLINKVQRYRNLLDAEIQDPVLRSYIGLVLNVDCQEFVGAMRDYYSPNVRIGLSSEIKFSFNRATFDHLRSERKVPRDDPSIIEAIRNRILLKSDLTRYSSVDELPPVLSCQEVWELGIRALKVEASRLYYAVIAESSPGEFSLAGVNKEIADKVRLGLDSLAEQDRARISSKIDSRTGELNYCVEHYLLENFEMEELIAEQHRQNVEEGDPIAKISQSIKLSNELLEGDDYYYEVVFRNGLNDLESQVASGNRGAGAEFTPVLNQFRESLNPEEHENVQTFTRALNTLELQVGAWDEDMPLNLYKRALDLEHEVQQGKHGTGRELLRDDRGFYVMDCLSGHEDALVAIFLNQMVSRLLFKELAYVDENYTQMAFDHAPKSKLPMMELNDPARDIRTASAGHEYEWKGIYLSSVLAMPYIQGIGLYFLALTYPFFCLSLIVPGRHHAFFLWMLLWFWVKSWDIGIAVVMILDRFLYNLFPHGPPITDAIANDPYEMFKTMLEVDPTYSVNTYFNLIATAILAVPVVTGILVKRGGGEVVHALAQGFHDFSGKIGFAMLQYHTALMNQDRADIQTGNELNALRSAKWTATTDPRVWGNILGAAAHKAITGGVRALEHSDVAKQDSAIRALSSVQGTMGDTFRKQAMAKATTAYRHNLANVLYNESSSYKHFRLNYDTIINWYSNHDWMQPLPFMNERGYFISQYRLRHGDIGRTMVSQMRDILFTDSKYRAPKRPRGPRAGGRGGGT